MCISRLFWITLLSSAVSVLGARNPSASPANTRTAPPGNRKLVYAHLPLSFEPNQGQTDEQVKFLSRGAGYTLFLTRDEAVLTLQKPAPRNQESPAKTGRGLRLTNLPVIQTTDDGPTTGVLRLKLLGANIPSPVRGVDELPGKSNYFIGNVPGKWRTNLPNYAAVQYDGIYPDVNLVYHGNQGQLEYDFVAAPGSNLHQVRFSLEGAERIRLGAGGDLVLTTKLGEVLLRRPEAYQGRGITKRSVAVRYVRRAKNEFGFAVGPYQRGRALVIDPVLSYSTFLGGSGGDVAYAVGVDSSGNAYVAGVTNSANFPTVNPEQSSNAGSGDAFVSKLNPYGTDLVYSTYLGGSGADSATGMAVDSEGDVFLTGSTSSSDFPIKPTSSTSSSPAAFQTVYGGNGDAFVAELGSTGDKLVYSSYLGGSQADFGQAIAVDSSGNAYVTGSTESPDFPTLNPLQTTTAGASDVFVTKVNFSGTALVYSTYLGGSQADTGQTIKVDKAGNAYVAGYTFSTNFPTQDPIQPSNAGDADAFVTELNPAGSALVFSTYLGGGGRDRAFGLALDNSGDIYVTGDTQSSDFPTTPNVFQAGYAGNGDAFVSELAPSGAKLSNSTFLGGSGTDQANGIALDSSGNAAIAGFTNSSDFPTVDPVQSVLGLTGGSSCGANPCSDAFVTKFNPALSQASYSTFLGGSGADFGQAVAVDSTGDPYVAGSTTSANFPAIAGVYQGSLGGVAGNAFVAKIDVANLPAIALSPAKINFGNQTVSVKSAAQAITVANLGSAPLNITSITPPTSDFTETDNCVGTVAPRGATCTINVTFTPAATGSVTDQCSITDNASGSPHTFTVTGTGVTEATSVTLTPTSLTFANQNVGTVSAPQTVTITNTGVATLNITQISASGDFTQTNTCGALLDVLNVGQSCTVSVSFAPTSTGTRSGSLTVSDNATGSPQSVALSGTGLAVFSLSSSNPASTVVIGSTSTTFTIGATAAQGFSGSITPSCPSGATCTFNPTSIFAGQTTTLTLSGLSASTPNPYNFTVSGTSGSQTATLNLTVLFQTFSLSVSPALNTIVAGATAHYTLLVSPSYGFNQQVNLSCTNVPVGATCSFSSASPTPNGSAPSSVSLTVTTTQQTSIWKLWPGQIRPPRPLLILGVVLIVLTLALSIKAKQLFPERASTLAPLIASRSLVLGILLVFLWLLGCRGISSNTSPTPTGNYIITVMGTLNSNTTVQETTTVDLSVT